MKGKTKMKRELGIARCGLACCMCSENTVEPSECRKGLYAEKIKARAFAEFARRYGMDELLDCLERNEQHGIVYHREGIGGDYDEFDDLEALIRFIRTGKR